MSDQTIIDLCGKVCPYPVVEIVREVERLRAGEALRCVVDDPLALKSVPEELEDFPDVSITIRKHSIGWEIRIARSSPRHEERDDERHPSAQ